MLVGRVLPLIQKAFVIRSLQSSVYLLLLKCITVDTKKYQRCFPSVLGHAYTRIKFLKNNCFVSVQMQCTMPVCTDYFLDRRPLFPCTGRTVSLLAMYCLLFPLFAIYLASKMRL